MNVQLDDALAVVERSAPDFAHGMSSQDILGRLPAPVPVRTLQYWLARLVADGRLVREGDRRWTRYRLPGAPLTVPSATDRLPIPVSAAGSATYESVRQPLALRTPVGYDRAFLGSYRPNVTFYLSEDERAQLAATGRVMSPEQPAGTHARQILDRLLIDLSWNSSRLEGNTYSMLDTKRLIELGEQADGRGPRDAQMILNHKDAIEFLVDGGGETGFDRHTLLNLHALLANNLLPDPLAVGRLRRIAVGIEGSVFHPLEAPQLVEEEFDQILATAAAIRDPFEQAFFVMVQLPYLQPFDDVNKRVSRLAANIPLICGNWSPLSFADVPREIYTAAILGVYERNRVDLLRDLFVWAYGRSADRYAAVRQSLGEPDPFRLRYRLQLRAVMGELVRGRTARREAAARIRAWSGRNIPAEARATFQAVVEAELAGLHEGNFARYQIRPSEFAAWRVVWDEPP